MEQFNNSEKDVRNPAMLALNTYESVIDQIRSSGLNFQLQLSPFSAQISLKRSLVKERSGVLRCPPPLKKEPSVHDHENWRENLSNNQIESFKNELNKLIIENTKCNEKLKEQEAEICTLKIENTKCEETLKEKEAEIFDLEKIVKVKNEVANRLNQQLRELKIKHETEIVSIKKMHKAEVKSWKKELGEERREKVNIEKKLEEVNLVKNEVIAGKSEQKSPKVSAYDDCHDTSNRDIFVKNNPKPEQFPLTRTGFTYRPSSAAQAFSIPRNCNCSRARQCIIRQPFPPPLPALTPLVNMSSLYHTRILSGEAPAATV